MTTTVVAPTIVADTTTVEVTSECYGDRYWVGGTGNWSDDTNHWARSSNGSPGLGNLPNEWCNVFIDSNSGFGGGGTITLDEDGYCKDFIEESEDTLTLNKNNIEQLYIYGSIELSTGLSFGLDFQINLKPSSSNRTIKSSGISIPNLFMDTWISCTDVFTLLDDLSIDYIEIYFGTFDANNFNVNANNVDIEVDETNSPVSVYMGSGTWEFDSTNNKLFYVYQDGEVDYPIIKENSTVKFTGSGNNSINNTGTTIELNNVWFSGSGNINILTLGNNLIVNDFKVDTPPRIIKFKEGTTTTVTTFTVSGTPGNLITLDSINGSDQFTLSKVSGVVACDYLDLSNSNATGGATWYAGSHSNDTDNNDGWIFSDPP